MRERITVDGEPLSEERFAEVYEEIAPYVEMVDAQGRRIQFFELLTAMAFAAFADTPVDVAVVEAGMGGSWDATNVADGTVAVITPISLDHTDRLGPDVPSIAGEKAGIIKPGATAVIAQQELPAAQVLMRRATEMGATVAREGLEFGVISREVAIGGQLLHLKGLKGIYEEIVLPALRRAPGGQRGLRAGRRRGADRRRRPAGRRAGTAGVRCRCAHRDGWRSCAGVPRCVVDAAHNPAGMQAPLEAHAGVVRLRQGHRRRGRVRGQGCRRLLDLLEPLMDEIVVTRNSSPRSMDVRRAGGAGRSRSSGGPGPPSSAWTGHRPGDRPGGRSGEFSGAGVLITGSVVTAGDARHLLKADRHSERRGAVSEGR